MQSSTLSFLRQTGGPSAMLPEPPTQNQRKLMQGGMGLTTPPECQEWERSTEIHLMNNEFSELPETLICPVLETLLLNGNSRLRKIPESFFNNMPALQILNLSRTRIKSLPKSLFQLINLKRLFLNHCELFMRLQPEIGKLRNLEILDLEGTWITNLPKEVQHLKTLTCLKLSFDDPVNYRKELLNEVIPRGVLSALAQLEELHIDVSPDDKRWNACVVDVASEVCGLTTLNTLKFYFPLVELLSGFNWSNPEGESLSLSRFRLTVGHHFKRIMSRTPHDIELEMEQYHRCLKYVNGAGVPEEIKVVLRYATAFFLDRHTDIKTLSELGCENMMQLNWCVVGECNEIRAIINGDQMGSWSSSEKNIGLTALVYLHIYRMKNLRSIWEGRVLDNGFTSLKALTLRTCPQLTTIFTPELLASFGNLEELLVDDCPVITALVCCDNSEHEATHFLPKLKKVSLHYLPELASISNAKGISMLPTVEWMSVYCCPKLLCLPIDKGYHTSLKKIKGERNWWEALEWTSTQQHSWDDIFVPINACD
uniref:Uncharacterized protein n=1 Tax=Rhizophora mucronata TaxID=61149 RepID=A0A2P2JA50_RHIMU